MSENTERDELAEIIQDCGEYIPGSHADDYVSPTKAADAILAAGYTKVPMSEDAVVRAAQALAKEDGPAEWDRLGWIRDSYMHRARVVLAAGYRKPRTITTVEELDALPVASAVLSDMGNVYIKDMDLDDPSAIWWVTAGAVSEFPSIAITLPATVLHEATL